MKSWISKLFGKSVISIIATKIIDRFKNINDSEVKLNILKEFNLIIDKYTM